MPRDVESPDLQTFEPIDPNEPIDPEFVRFMQKHYVEVFGRYASLDVWLRIIEVGCDPSVGLEENGRFMMENTEPFDPCRG